MKLQEMYLIDKIMESQQLDRHISSERLNGQRVHVLSSKGRLATITKHPHHFSLSMKVEDRQVYVDLDFNLNITYIDSGRWSLSDEDVINKKEFEAKVAKLLPTGLGLGK